MFFHAAVGQAIGQEVDDRCLIAGVERDGLDAVGELWVLEVAGVVVEGDDFGQRGFAAVVEVRAVSFTLRRPGVLKAPRSLALPLTEKEAAAGPRLARPRSSAVGRTPMLWKP
ncbi:MAG TPA: hypothetical protein VJV78_28705 [Polyangiales bacterium]|nr:hypothetical protein [Polyangiales bacterium]